MKRYLAFFGDNFYPNGGMGDFLIDHDNVDDAETMILVKFKESFGNTQSKWGHVYDTVNKEIVYKK